jgi:sensor histidine kinase YesM
MQYNFPFKIKFAFSMFLALTSMQIGYSMDTLHLDRESYEVRGPYRYLTDEGYSYTQASGLIDDERYKSYKDKGRLFRSYNSYWVAIVLSNDSDDLLPINAEGKFDSVWVSGERQTCCKSKPCNDPRGIIKQAQLNHTYFQLKPGTHLFIAKISSFHLNKDFGPYFYSSASFEGNLYKYESGSLYLLIVLIGIFFILGTIAISIFIRGKDYTFMWSAIFCFSIMLHFIRTVGEKFESFDLINGYLDWAYAKMFLFILYYSAYLFFSLYLINAKLNYTQQYKIALRGFYLLMLTLIPEVILLGIGKWEESYTFYFSVRFATTLYFIYLCLKMLKYRTDIYVQFAIVGGLSLLVGDVLTSIHENAYTKTLSTIGTMLNVVVFSAAISYKVFISKMKQLQAQSDQMQSQNKILELNYEKSILNMNLLQSKMNPHFIFNSLNSIKYHIINQENEKASYYLSKFSKLVREVLNQSTQQSISLAKEIEVVNLYLEMEALRFDDNFVYQLNIDKNVEVDMISVPPHIIQPYVENAIVHAFIGKKDICNLSINIYEESDNLMISIEDNGIGRKASHLAKQSKFNDGHVSQGHSITNERIKQYGKLNNSNSSIEIIDLEDQAGVACGTRVEIRL